MSINRQIDKEDVTHIYNAILLSHKEEWNDAICSDSGGPRECHTGDTNQRKRNVVCYDLNVHSKKKMGMMNEFIYKTELELQM